MKNSLLPGDMVYDSTIGDNEIGLGLVVYVKHPDSAHQFEVGVMWTRRRVFLGSPFATYNWYDLSWLEKVP